MPFCLRGDEWVAIICPLSITIILIDGSRAISVTPCRGLNDVHSNWGI